MSDENVMHGTTILSVRKGDEVVVAGDGLACLHCERAITASAVIV